MAINIMGKNINILRNAKADGKNWIFTFELESERHMGKGMHEDFREKRLRGNVDFPFELYEMKTEGELIFVDYHWQEEVEILRVEEGELSLLIDGIEVQLYAGEVAFVNPGQMHQMKGLTQDTIYYAYVFPLKALLFEQEDLAQVKLLRPLLENRIGFPVVLSDKGELSNWIRDKIDAIIDWNKSHPVGFEILTKAGLLEIICILAQHNCYVEYHSTRQNDVCKEILLYIQNNFKEKITISDIAKTVGISENYFSSFFTKHLKRGFANYLIEYRINLSCILLETTELSITDIALECGFSTPSYYIHSFRKLKKMTPYQYKHRE